MASTHAQERVQTQVRVNSFIRSVYNWMAVGLALTGAVAWMVAGSETLIRLFIGNRLLFFGLIIGSFLTACIFRIPYGREKGPGELDPDFEEDENYMR